MNQRSTISSLGWGCQARIHNLTSQYAWRISLLLSLALSGIILAVQFPSTIYGPDGSFHAAKILRASKGEFFIDPYVGTPTIYPPLFHFCFGSLKRALDVDSIQMIKLIVLVDFIGLFAAFYYFARPFFDNDEQTSFCVLSLPLVFYAPTGRSIIMAEPSNFSFVFLIFGLGALYRYLIDPRPIYLVLGGLLSSLAVNIWWFNIFSVSSILLLFSYYAIKRGPMPKPSHILLFVSALLVPGFYTAWQFYNIWEILPNYVAGDSKQRDFTNILVTWLTTFLTKGNLQFIHYFYFWDLSKGPLANVSLPDGVKLLHSLTSILHYFLVVLPFNLLLVLYVCWILSRNDKLILSRASLTRTLPVGGLFVLLFSIGVYLYGDPSALWRVHFIVYVLFLVFAYKTVPLIVGSEKLRKLSICICVASIFSLIYTVLYTSRFFTNTIPETDREVVRFVASIPNHDNEPIFMVDDGLRRIAPFVTLQSIAPPTRGERLSATDFFDKRRRLYHSLDPITASKMYGDFVTIKEKREDWVKVLRDRKIKWFIFRTSDPMQLTILRQYQDVGSIILKNRDWVVLEVSVD